MFRAALSLVSILMALPSMARAAEPVKYKGCDIAEYGFMIKAAQAFEAKTGIKIELQRAGDTAGIRALVAGEVHMGGTCRHALSDERGVRLVPVAWDALVVVVHPSNPVKNLTAQQARDIFLGKITNWKQVGGEDRPILVLVRPGKRSGVGLAVRELLFRDVDASFTSAAKEYPSSGPLEEALEQTPNGVAFTGITTARLRRVKALSLDGKEPSPENVRSGSYLLYRPLYISIPESDVDPRVKKFVRFIVSEDGQAAIAASGTVNLRQGKGLWERYQNGMRALTR